MDDDGDYHHGSGGGGDDDSSDDCHREKEDCLEDYESGMKVVMVVVI